MKRFKVGIDLDGTLCDQRWRLHLLAAHPPDWDKFLGGCGEDPPYEAVVRLAKVLEANPGTDVVYLSARDETLRERSETWLGSQGLRSNGEPLVLRGAEDRREDQIVKRELVEGMEIPPDLMIDDRPRVLEAWRTMGIPALETGTWQEVQPHSKRPRLYLMIGPAGAGKTHLLESGLREELGLAPAGVIASDEIRAEVQLPRGKRWSDKKAQDEARARQDDPKVVFDLVHKLAAARIAAGLDTLIDATNLKAEDRKGTIARVGPAGRVIYLVVDRPMEQKVESKRDRVPEEILLEHHRRFDEELPAILDGDGDPFVEVRDLRQRAAGKGDPAEDKVGPYHPIELPARDEVVRRCEAMDGFRAVRRGPLISCDYLWIAPGMWDDPVLRECRGLLFDADTGEIAARPLHKFHNWGEIPDQDESLDFGAPHEVLDKRDGTLFYPAELSRGEVLWCTRAGETDLAKELRADTPPGWCRAVEAGLLRDGDGDPSTPLFEHTSPWNRIVVAYGETKLTWIAARVRETGRYWTREEMEEAADRVREAYGIEIEVVREAGQRIGDRAGMASLVEETKAGGQDREGIVIAFEGGHRIKMKTEAYLIRHRVRDDLAREDRVFLAICRGADDDLVGLAPPEARAPLEAYQAAVAADLKTIESRVEARIEAGRELSRKEFALALKGENVASLEQAVSFQTRDRAERGAPLEIGVLLREQAAKGSGRREAFAQRVKPALETADWSWTPGAEA